MMKATTVILMVLSGLCLLPSCFPRLYILVEKPKNWTEAQTYCRQKYTDLASVHNEQQLAELKKLLEGYLNVWIGLYADAETWRWSDGSAHLFSKLVDGGPSPTNTESCAVSNFGKWHKENCNQERNFVCYIDPMMKKHMVRVELQKTGTAVDIEDLKEDILQEFKQKLKDHGLNEDINLRWVEQPDGKVFHKKHTYKKEKESRTLK